MDTTQLLKGVLDVAVLAVVEDEDGYGYDVLRRLRAGGLSEVGDASVYGTLRRLYAAGALTSYVVPSDEGPHRKYYGITPGRPRAAADAGQGLVHVLHHRHRAAQRHPHRDPGSPRMNTTTVRPEVAAFLDRVRQQLADLDEEQREELLDGLEADLSEQVAAGDALPDPVAYAAELRAAAGVAAARRPRGRWLGVEEVLDQTRARVPGLDRAQRADRQRLAPRRGAAAGVVGAPRLARGHLPRPGDRPVGVRHALADPRRPVRRAAAARGRGRGQRADRAQRALARLRPGPADHRPRRAARAQRLRRARPADVRRRRQPAVPQLGASAVASPVGSPDPTLLRHGPDVVRNIYAYDAHGQPLQGVQLYDQKGRPVAVSESSSMGSGQAARGHLPVVQRHHAALQRLPAAAAHPARGTCARGEPAGRRRRRFREPPLASVPPATSPVTSPVTSP